MRLGDWVDPLNVEVKRAEERPDDPAGDVVYRVKEIFTTRDGSWEVRPGLLGSISQWARDAYLRPWNAPDVFDDAGADHHLFARVLDRDGAPVTDRDLVIYWSDGFHKLGDSAYAGYAPVTPKQHSGWANLVMAGGSDYVPERGEQGPWCWCPRGAADVVVGGGMPANHHISFFAVWQAEPRGGGSTGGDAGTGTEPAPDRLAGIRQAAWRQVGVAFHRDSSFARYARDQGLGAPLTDEFDTGGFRVQGFAGGIVYAPIGRWDAIDHIAW